MGKLAAQYRLPAIYQGWPSYVAKDGGLISYGIDRADAARQVAGYGDRILTARSQPFFRCRHP